MIIVAATDSEAHAKHAALKARIDIEFGVQYLSTLAGTDLSMLQLDEPLPDWLRRQPVWSRLELVMEMARRGHMTFREIAIHYADSYGHQVLVGSPNTIADQMQLLFESGVADGFLLRSTHYPAGLDDIVTLLIPELQRRGLFRNGYEGTTFRDNLGLPRPPHPSARSEQVAAT
jgi:alkanesulfonate monooxygenase SsuD/methylene tetrahydromethanopterin reductase-like flavin-dependent oxidoreductase (luciferase family)